MLHFTNDDGSPTRGGFTCVEEVDELMVENWNKVVRPEDKVYHLGDVAIARRNLSFMKRLNGKKCLIKGNHDIFKINDYTEHFYDIRAMHVYGSNDKDPLTGKYNSRAVLCHVPIHSGQLFRFPICIHGHLHGNIVKDQNGNPDMRYVNVCVEHTNYTPILLDRIIEERKNYV